MRSLLRLPERSPGEQNLRGGTCRREVSRAAYPGSLMVCRGKGNLTGRGFWTWNRIQADTTVNDCAQSPL
jgi:hypothetical protein